MSCNHITKKCHGCGAWLHNDQQNLVGYTPKDWQCVSFCQGCYQLKHYEKPRELNIQKSEAVISAQEGFVLSQKQHSKKFVSILVSDVYNLGILAQLDTYPLAHHVIIVINKSELIGYHQTQLLKNLWTQTLIKLQKRFEIIFLSAKTNIGINQLINDMRNYFEICFLGNTGVGKSQLIKQIGHKLGVKIDNLVGNYLNTTQGVLATKIGKIKLIDTPGSQRMQGIFQFLDALSVKHLQTSKWNKRVFQFSTHRNYCWENYCMISIKPENDQLRHSIIFHGPSNLEIHHTNPMKTMVQTHPDVTHLQKYFHPVTWTKYQFQVNQRLHLCIDDLGWVVLSPQGNVKIIVYLPNKVHLQSWTSQS